MEKLFLDIEKAKIDDSYFAEKLLDFTPFDYQDKIDWNQKRIIICGGRRSGKDTLVVKRRIIPLMFKNKNVKVGVYAPGWEEAATFMDIFRDAIEETPLAKSITVNKKFEIGLSNKSRLLCRIASKLSTGKRGRGFDLLYMTEAAYIADEDMSVIRPTRIIGSAPEIQTSTPFGLNHFSKAMDSGVYKVYHWKSEQSPLVSKEDLEEERKLCTDLEYRQEWEGEVISDAGQAIPDALIKKIYEGKDLKLKDKAEENKTYVAGVDLGRRRDKSTIYVLEVDWPSVTVAYYKEFQINKKDPRFYQRILEHIKFLIGTFQLNKINIDQTGLGDMPTVELKRIVAESSIPCVIEGVDFTYSLKHKWEGLINQAVLKFERHEIHSPFIKQLVVQLRSIRFNPKTQMYETKGPSPDHAMALFLAIRAATKPKYYFGTASNKVENVSPLIEREDLDLKEKIKTGYALKASEIGPNNS